MTKYIILIISLLIYFPSRSQEAYKIFESGVISLSGVNEGSPSVTADGNTLVFTRYQSYRKKVPYIAEKVGSVWEVSRLNFVDTLYNLAISPDGQTIFYKIRKSQRPHSTFKVNRKANGTWSRPQQLQGDLITNAGYFRMAKDGTLYMYIAGVANQPKGIYYAEPGDYENPQWLSDAVSPYPATVYSAIPSSDEQKIIVNRGGLVTDEDKAFLGPKGLRVHEQHNGRWDLGKRIEGIPYTWYAEILPDGRMLFVKDGDLYVISLRDLNIKWN